MGKTRSSPKGALRRQTILDAAQKRFSADGFHSASLSEIASDTGISQAGLLHHFPSKSDLLLAVLRDRDERNARDEGIEERTGVAYLNAFLHMLQRSESDRGLIQLHALISAESLASGHPAHEHFVQSYESKLRRFSDALDGLFDEDALPPGVDRFTIARWVVALADGMRYQLLLEGAAVHRAEMIAGFLETLRPYMRDQTTRIDAGFQLDDGDPPQ